jgi:hypothetical protein
MGAIRNMNWTQLMRAFTVCGSLNAIPSQEGYLEEAILYCNTIRSVGLGTTLTIYKAGDI